MDENNNNNNNNNDNQVSGGDDFEILLDMPPQMPISAPEIGNAERVKPDFEITLKKEDPPAADAGTPAEGEKGKTDANTGSSSCKSPEAETPESPVTPHEKKPKKKKKSGSCLITLLFFALLAGGGYYGYTRYPLQIRAGIVKLELLMNFRIFKSDVSKMSRDEINDIDAKKRTEVHKTAEEGDLARMKKLLDAGGDLKALDADKNTVFHYAAKSGNVELLKFLRKKSPKLIKNVNKQNETALHVAARYNHLEAVKFLLSCRIDPRIKNSDKKTAYDLSSSPEVKAVLKKTSAPRSQRPRRR